MFQPDCVSRLIVEDVAPAVSTAAVDTFPQYFAAMNGVVFDQSIQSLGELRRDVDRQLRPTFPVCRQISV